MTQYKKNQFINFTNFLDKYSKKYKKKIFYMSKYKKDEISYEKLLRIINNFKTVILNYKISYQDKIMVICDNSENLVIIFLSILYHKSIFIPVNPNSTKIEFDFIYKKTKPKIIITTELLAQNLRLKKIFFC